MTVRLTGRNVPEVLGFVREWWMQHTYDICVHRRSPIVSVVLPDGKTEYVCFVYYTTYPLIQGSP